MAEAKVDQASARSAPSSRKTYYASNLRSSLTALVILHHAATSYGGEGRGPYQSSLHSQGSSAALVGFNAINQSFFMGSFMYLGGHFSRKALERKGRITFLKERLYRLGLPTAAYTLIGAPFCFAYVQKCNGNPVIRPLMDYYKDMRGVRGPLWFTATLLTFDFALAGVDWLREKWSTGNNLQLSTANTSHVGAIGLFSSIVATSLADFLLRSVYPVGTILNPWKLNIGYVSQYVACYIFGVCAPTLEYAIPTTSTYTALGSLAGTASVLLAKGVLAEPTPFPANLAGGWNMLAAYYAAWGNICGYFLGSSVLAMYSKHFTRNWMWINDFAFPAFVVHIPVLTVLGCATDSWHARGVIKTAVVGSATTVASWALGYVGSEIWSKVEHLWKKFESEQK